MPHLSDVFLAIAAIPFIYYLIAIYSSWRYFRQPASAPDAVVYAAGQHPETDSRARSGRLRKPGQFLPAGLSGIRNRFLRRSGRRSGSARSWRNSQPIFPQCRIRVLHGSGRVATNDKVAKLARLVSDAAHEVVVISDSDVRVRPDYLRQVVAPLRDPKVGAVTCFYVPTELKTLTDHLQTVGMMSDFYAGILVAWQLDGVKFALGPTIATTRARLDGFGGYPELENRPADDLLVGRLIAEQGYEVVLLRYSIETVCDYGIHRRSAA